MIKDCKNVSAIFLIILLMVFSFHNILADGLTYDCFDVTAKYIYAKAKDLNVQAEWPVNLYRAHLRVMNKLNGVSQAVAEKALDRLQMAFNELLMSVKNDKTSQEVLKIMERYRGVLDQSDLVAAYLFYHHPLGQIGLDRLHKSITADYFKNKINFPQGYLDDMALQYCELKENTFISLLFPCVEDRYEEIKKIFRQFGTIVHDKTIELTFRGAFNLVLTAYDGASYMGTYANKFAGARTNATKRFINATAQGMYPVRVILCEFDNVDMARTCKTAVRGLFNYGPYPIHINDTHLETMTLARTVFNKNSIDFLNRADRKKFANFDHHFDYYKDFIQTNSYASESFCIDGSTIMAVHGLRDCDDVDFLHFGYDFLPQQLKKHPIIHSHNLDTLKHHPHSKDEIIFDPENYFYYKNLKFATLQELRATKAKRKLVKDFTDIRLIDRCLSRFVSSD